MGAPNEESGNHLAGLEEGWQTRHFLPDPHLTFPAVFAERVRTDPNGRGLTEVTFRKHEPQAIRHSFSDLSNQAHDAALRLSKAGVESGDRIVLCLSNTSSFLSFFVAAQALGAIPVPLPAVAEYHGPAAFRERVGSVVRDCEPRAVVVDSAQAVEAASSILPEGIAFVDTSVTETESTQSTPPSLRFDRSFDEVAFIQYTSGSTGSPKGVVVTHYNLVANMRASTEAAGFGPDDRSLSWLPLYHDMGLVGGLLLGIYLGIDTFVLPTRSFVGRPDSWLRAISHFRATFSCAPNFAYNILAKRLPESGLRGLDLSSWRLAFNGAEPIDVGTLEDFARRFGASGLSPRSPFPVYGMAECALAVSFPVPGEPVRKDVVDRERLNRAGRADPVDSGTPGSVTFASVGRALPGHRVRIVQPAADIDLPDRHLGEIVVTGPSVTPYYYQKDRRYDPPRKELRTGDLGYIADGELYIVDRIKDLLIVGGRNIVPSDVERVVSALPGVRYGAVVAFTLRGGEGTDELYVVAGAEPRASSAIVELRQLASDTVYRHFGISPRDVVMVKPGVIPKTSSGKLRRLACRELYERGGYRAEGGFRKSSRPPPVL